MYFVLIIEFILVTAAGYYLERVAQLQKARLEAMETDRLIKAMEVRSKMKCLKLEEEVKALRRFLDEFNAKYTRYQGNLDKLNRRRMDIEDIYDDAKRRLEGMKMTGSYGSQQRAANLQYLQGQSTKVRATLGPLLIGALITLGTQIIMFVFEAVRLRLSTEARLNEIEKLENQCPCEGLNAASGSDDYLRIFSIISKPENTQISISFNAYQVGDKLIISVDGNVIYDSGCVGTGAGGNGQSGVSATAIVPANSNVMTVQVIAECGAETGTVWDFSIDGICILEELI
jgi:hypothetical protein